MSVSILVRVFDYLRIVIKMASVNYTIMVLGLVLAIKRLGTKATSWGCWTLNKKVLWYFEKSIAVCQLK